MMIKLEQVNPIDHQTTFVTALSAHDTVCPRHMVPIAPSEFAAVSQYYPIVFAKQADTGQFGCYALLGLMVDENLFIEQGRWQVPYLPLAMQSEPFYLAPVSTNECSDGASHGTDTGHEAGTDAGELALFIDTNNPRVNNQHQGEALFCDGKASPYLSHMANLLAKQHQGCIDSQLLIAALLDHELLEPVTLDITFANGTNNHLTGLYTINQQHLSLVPTKHQRYFEANGWVSAIAQIIVSLTQVKAMISRKNARRNAGLNAKKFPACLFSESAFQ